MSGKTVAELAIARTAHLLHALPLTRSTFSKAETKGANPESPSNMNMTYRNLILTSATRKLVPTLGLAICMFFAAQVAKADNYVFSVNNFGQVGNLGTVTTTLSGNNILVTVSTSPLYVIHGAGVGFNTVNGFTGITIDTINSASIFSADLGAHNFDGFGSFADSVASNQSTAQARAANTNSVSFLVHTTTLGGFTNASQINDFAVQIAPLSANNPNTGFAHSTLEGGVTPRSVVPEPASMFLLGSGLVGAAASIRRRRSKK